MYNSDQNPHKITFLEFMPVSLFGAVMGLSALCFAWRFANQSWHFGSIFAEIIGGTAILCFILLVIAYVIKWLRYPISVETEFKSPVSIGFFSTVTISLMLIPGIILPYSYVTADIIWLIGITLTFFFAWFVLRKWMGKQQLPESAMPVWVLPVTGTLNVPIIGNSLKFAGAHEFCLMFFGIGIIFIIILMTMIVSRLFFQAPLTATAQPSLLILVAPFALAFNGYVGLSGLLDIAASAFFYFCLFLLVIFGSKIFLLPKCCPFQVSWWSVSFPLSSVTVACFKYGERQSDNVHWILAACMLTIATAVILYLFVQTIFQIWTGRFGRVVEFKAPPMVHPELLGTS